MILDQDEEAITKDPEIDQNLIRISHNVLFESPGYTLKADIIEIDLVTKFSKIYMLDKQKKVKVELKQNGSN